MLFKNKTLNLIFAVQLILFGLIITGILPREVSLFMAAGLALYVLIAPLEDGVIFFVMSIPLFLALPITETFDNFNTWRILSAIMFMKWIWPPISNFQFSIFNKLSISQFSKKLSKPSKLLLFLLLLAVLSLIPAGDKLVAIKRIIYFVNLSLIGIVIYDLIRKNSEFTKRLVKSIVIPAIIVTVVGYAQVISTYLIDVYQFMALWGEGIQCRQFGNEWCYIAVHVGNTWLAYYGAQLSLRVFSLFPDSHSFPQFVLLGLPAIFAISLKPLWKFQGEGSRGGTSTGIASEIGNWKLMRIVRTRMSMSILWVPAMLLIAILSGTRGIWAASVGVLIIIAGVIYWTKRTGINSYYRNIFKYISLYMLVFFMLFSVAFPVFFSPQFLLSNGDWGLLGNRIKSIIDFGETSNAQRILIWKASLRSIVKHPILGVGIGNYPVVLEQNIELSKAGSSAHNIYLHIAAEMGIPALAAAVWLLWLLFKKTYYNFIYEKDPLLVTYFGAALIFVPWVLIYSLTDVALFDERAFSLFVVTISTILANKKP